MADTEKEEKQKEEAPKKKTAAPKKTAAKKAGTASQAKSETKAAPKKETAAKKAPAKKAPAKKAKTEGAKYIRVTQIGSPIGRQAYQRKTLIGLGLNKMHRSRELEDTPAVRGMVNSISHLVKMEEVA